MAWGHHLGTPGLQHALMTEKQNSYETYDIWFDHHEFFFFFWIHKCDMIKGISWMSGILSLSNKLKEVTNQKVFFKLLLRNFRESFISLQP